MPPLLFAAFLWWLTTGVVLLLVRARTSTFRLTAIGTTIIAIAAMAAVYLLRDKTTVSAAYSGFAAGLALWCWHEVMFLLGFVSGPEKRPCPEGLKTWPRFILSTRTILHHELSIAAHGLLIAALSWQAENAVALYTYLLLWGMRISAKLMVFFGAPNLSAHFLPRHLDYLKSYFGSGSSPAFIVLAISAVSIATVLLVQRAIIATENSFEATSFALLATLAALALFEHLALVLPLRDSALWSWAYRQNSISPTTLSTTKKRDIAPSEWSQ